MRHFAVVLVALVAAGCASAAPDGLPPAETEVQGGLSRLSAFVRADLDAALADAKAHNDETGAQCWTTLLRHVGTGSVGQIPAIKGVASAWQVARNVRRSSNQGNPVLEDINRGCAAMVVEARMTLIRLGLIATGAGGAPGAIGGIIGR